MSTLLADLGGTRLKSGLAPQEVVAVTHDGDWRAALSAALERTGADELALAVPGLVEEGRVVSLPGKLTGLAGADLSALLGVPVPLVVNDAIAYGVGEAVGGAGRGASRVVVVTLGTGVGVAVVEDGAPLGRGRFGGGLLGGQLPLGGGGPVDTAGRAGTFEAHCRADALVASVPGAVDVESAYALGDLTLYRGLLVRGLTALCLAHAPDVVVVGGGAARPALLEGVQEQVVAGLWPGQSVQVRMAELGDAAALAGLRQLLRARVTA